MSNSSEKSVGCTYCGAAPTPHALIWVDTAISIYFDRTMRIVCKPLIPLFTPFVRWLTNTLMHVFFSLSARMGLASFSDEYASEEIHRKKVMFDEAKKRGIRMQIIYFLGKEVSYTRAKLPFMRGTKVKAWHYFEHIPIPPWRDSPLSENLDNKMELKQLFEKNGLPVPNGGPVVRKETALRMFEGHAPVIVKPLEGSRARHTRVRVTEVADLYDALMRALQVCPVALVEEFKEGDVHRVTCVGGKFIAAMRFVRPTVTADGQATAHQLREQYNATLALPHVAPVADDSLFALTLEHQGYTKDSMPSAGTILRLADFSERTNGGYNEDVTDEIPEASRALFERAAKVSKLPVVGFDVVSRDITNAQEEVTILEANTAPFIDIHHAPTKGLSRNIAAPVWDLWFS